MARRWVLGVAAAIAVVCVAGVGFSAFTAQATVYGSAYAATVGLEFTQYGIYDCFYLGHSEPAPGKVVFSDLSAGGTQVTLTVSNLTPDDVCETEVTLENTGDQPLNVSITLNTPGENGVCGPYGINCFDIATTSGIQAAGEIYFGASPTDGVPTSYSHNFTTLQPGHTYEDLYALDIPWGSTDATPASASFTLVYSASIGFNEDF